MGRDQVGIIHVASSHVSLVGTHGSVCFVFRETFLVSPGHLLNPWIFEVESSLVDISL